MALPPGLGQRSAQRHSTWWHLLQGARSHSSQLSPTHLCKTNMANAGTCLPDTSAPSSTLGLSHPKGEFEGAQRAVTKGEPQRVASGCPGSQTAMRGERNPALGNRGLKAMQPFLQDMCQSPNLSHAVHSSSTGASYLASWRDHKTMPFLPVITRWCL